MAASSEGVQPWITRHKKPKKPDVVVGPSTQEAQPEAQGILEFHKPKLHGGGRSWVDRSVGKVLEHDDPSSIPELR